MATSDLPLKGIEREPIPGYKVLNRIGSGGYGEVWSAEAPGGLYKAIKFVYGNLSDTRANRELKSLNRIKEVHHPFLLSLERIEIVDGHLIIITELADGSLKDRFDECRANGLHGIPRDELLVYVRDTADALDYIYENHSLQHLDIKPENLLLLGKRIKVADFGLLKDLEMSASMVGGMTPLYAPPEVFDGKPTRNSDQYSLAIVYQEMLTGEPPFAGTTTAQLAAQHLHCAPTLSSLPKSDQPVIAKALTKDPDHRFPNCRSMVDRLIHPERYVTTTKAARVRASQRLRRQTSPSPKSSTEGATPVIAPPRELNDLPPLDLQRKDACYEPTLFIGLGGMAGRVLQRLRQRLHDRYGDLNSVPAVQMLLFDTDPRALTERTTAGEGIGLREIDTVPIPLRRPSDYRASSERLLESISRRWIYNIPRSLQTEGFRPLGRLAFVDHFDVIFQRLQQVIQVVTDKNSAKESARATGIPFAPGTAPRIYVISSIAGGTGSGIALDLTYAVRQILVESGLTDDRIVGLFTHSTSCKPGTRDLAIANSYSFLRELQHYANTSHSYPGDTGCGLSAFYDNNCPYRDTYLVHLGDELSEEEFDASTDILAEYVYRDTLTTASAFFRKSRDLEHADVAFPLSERRLRTFWLSKLGAPVGEIPFDETRRLCRDLVRRWRGIPVRPTEPPKTSLAEVSSLVNACQSLGSADPAEVARERQVSTACAEYLVEREMGLDPLIGQTVRILEGETCCEIDAHLAKLVQETYGRAEGAERGEHLTPPGEQTLSTIDNVIGVSENVSPGGIETLKRALTERLGKLVEQEAAGIRDWVVDWFNKAESPVDTAERAVACFLEQMSEIEEAAIAESRRQRTRAEELVQAMRAAAEEARSRSTRRRDGRDAQVLEQEPSMEQRVHGYAKARLNQMAYRVVYEALRAVRGCLGELSREVKLTDVELREMSRVFEGDDRLTTTQACPIVNELDGWRSDLVGALYEKLKTTSLSERSLFETLRSGGRARESLLQDMKTEARAIAIQAVNAANIAYLVRTANAGGAEGEESFSTGCLASAAPGLLHCGGDRRILLVVPDGKFGKALRKAVLADAKQEATVIMDSDQQVLLCSEIHNVPLESAAATIIDGRHQCVEIAHRLRSRVDVDWSSI